MPLWMTERVIIAGHLLPPTSLTCFLSLSGCHVFSAFVGPNPKLSKDPKPVAKEKIENP
jgi:hypothetical protein